MPKIPEKYDITSRGIVATDVAPDVVNAVRNSASIDYRHYVPIATPGVESLKAIGAVLMDNPALRAELAGGLIERVAKVQMFSRMYRNKLEMFNKGLLGLGELVEHVFLELAKPHQYDPENAYKTELQMEKPDMRTVYYIVNVEIFYKQTIFPYQWEKVFLSWDEVTSMIERIISYMVTAANYDSQQITLYMIGRWLLDGKLKARKAQPISKSSAGDLMTDILYISNDFTDMSRKYNLAGVRTHSDKDYQYMILSSMAGAVLDVNVLAAAFNKSYVEFAGKQVMIGSFGNLDTERLNEIFRDKNNPGGFKEGYKPLTPEEIKLLDSVPAVLCDWEFIQIYDKHLGTGYKRIEEGEYENHWMHRHSIYALSPFAQAVAFVPSEMKVSSVAIEPKGATLSPGGKMQFQAAVSGDNFVDRRVAWSCTEGGRITAGGVFTATGEAGTTVTVTATSLADSTKAASAQVSIA